MGTEDRRSSWMMITNMLGSIHSSCDVPAGAIFGPCDPPGTSLGDSIAFIALKCSDRCAPAYAYQVDTSLASLSTEAPVWLHLVRSARCAEEQNLEAFVKDSHLFFRALKTISTMSELLVWYGTDLAELLNISYAQKCNTGYRCCYCRQSFLFEFPVLAHQRFLCTQRPRKFVHTDERLSNIQNKPPTDFHNLAKNLESLAKRRHSLDSESGDESDREKPLSGEPSHLPFKRVHSTVVKRKPLLGSSTVESAGSETIMTSMTNEGRHSSPWATHCLDNQDVLDSKAIETSPGPHSVPHTWRRSPLPSTGPEQTQKSAFVQPPRSIPRTPNIQVMSVRFRPGITPTTFPSIPTHPVAAARATGPQAVALFNRGLLRQQSLLCEAGIWSKKPKLLQARTRPGWSRLPTTLSPLGLLPAQNWCAKCSISFHMTSDLVQHMRSHHKRSSEQPRQSDQARLRCPVCEEGFRERHHLSRHMTSHL